jgi:hypothetical protein
LEKTKNSCPYRETNPDSFIFKERTHFEFFPSLLAIIVNELGYVEAVLLNDQGDAVIMSGTVP